MNALIFMAKNNLKKKKGEVFVLILLTAISAMICYCSMSVITGITNILDTAYQNAHTADVMYLFDKGHEDKLTELFDSDQRVTKYESSELVAGMAEYRSSLSMEPSEYTFWIDRIEEKRTIGTLYGTDAQDPAWKPAENDILLPYYLKTFYAIDDDFYFAPGGKEYRFRVAGFFEDPMLSTPLSVTVYHVYISQAYYDKMMEEEPALSKQTVTLYRLRLEEGINTIEFEEEMTGLIAREVSEAAEGTARFSLNWMGMRGAGCIMSYVGMGLALVFSGLLICVTLIIVCFGIRNFMERNLKNIGILMAGGYTAKQLRRETVLEMGLVSAAGAFAGVIFGILGSGVTGSLQAILSGLRWEEKINIGIAFSVFAAIVFIVCGTAYLSGGTYKKITVLDALRGGIHTHNFKKSVFPIESNRLPLPLLLAFKGIFSEKRKSIGILGIVVLLFVTTCVSFSLFEHFVIESDTLLDFAGIDNGDVAIYGNDLTGIKEELKKWDEISGVLTYQTTELKLAYKDAERTISCDIWDDFGLLQHDILLEGRFPKHQNEMVLSTNAANELGVTVGDVIYLEGRSGRLDYLITGIDQKINHMGKKALLTVEGMVRADVSAHAPALYLYLKEGVSFTEIEEKLKQHYTDIEISDSRKVIAESISGIAFSIGMICVVFLVITGLVVIFVEILLIRSKVAREKKNYGIHKALGYTTAQLTIWTMMSNMPLVVLGAAVGAIVSEPLGNRLAMVCFSLFGFKKVSLPVSLFWRICAVTAITVIALAAAFLAALKIRKIDPVKLLTEEEF